MTNSSIFNSIISFFTQIYNLGNNIKIYSDNGVEISLNQFILALSIMFIVLTSLVNIVKSRSSATFQDVDDRVRKAWYKNSGSVKGEEKNPYA